MPAVRYLALVLLICAPMLAVAQQDSVVVREGDLAFPAYPATFGQPFEQDVPVGPAQLTVVEPLIGCREDPDDPGVFIPAVDNPEEVEGMIALISRGACRFDMKVEAASSAGAIGVIVMNDDRVPDDNEDLVNMGGDCDPAVCSAPAVFVSRASGLALYQIADRFKEAVLDPVRINFLCGDPILFGTERVLTFVRDDGFIGYPSNRCVWGFVLDWEEGLGVASVLIGQAGEDEVTVTGSPYAFPSEYGGGEGVYYLTPPFAPPFESFDDGYESAFSSPLGVRVSERAYARHGEGDTFIVFDLDITNTTSAALDDIYVGVFADWEVGDADQNLGGFDEATNLLYVYDDSGASASYFGVAMLGATEIAGWTLATDEAASDPSLFAGMTTAGEVLEQPQDARTVIGVGPFDLAASETENVRFALVAGADEEEIRVGAQTAQQAIIVAAESVPSEEAFALAPVYPNPAATEATVALDLPTAQAVRVAVFDVLGRRVAVVHEGPLGAGTHRLGLDAAALPAGVYVVRAAAGGERIARKLVVAR